jgi:hypothetical protein
MIGIISDSHDNIDAIKEAIALLNEENVEMVIHAGDIISPFIARIFEDLNADLKIVFGNNDGDRMMLRMNFERMGAEVLGEFGRLVIDDKRICVIHGTEEEIVSALASSGMFDLVIRGHTHEASITEDPFIINPGEVCGYLTGRRSLALLDMHTMEADIVEF